MAAWHQALGTHCHVWAPQHQVRGEGEGSLAPQLCHLDSLDAIGLCNAGRARCSCTGRRARGSLSQELAAHMGSVWCINSSLVGSYLAMGRGPCDLCVGGDREEESVSCSGND